MSIPDRQMFVSDEQTPDTHPNAGRASGYTDGDGNDVGENIINKVTKLMIGPQTKMLLLADQLAAIVATQDQRFGYLLRQLEAHLTKEDARHDALARSEDTTLAVLTSVVQRLDEINEHTQLGVTIARQAEERAKELGRVLTAHLTKLETHLTKLEKNLDKLEKAVTVLKKGQTDQSAQLQKFVTEIADLRAQIVALGLLAEKANVLTEETNRLTEETNRLTEEHTRLTMEHQALADDVADLKAWRAALEARSNGK